MSVRKIFNIFCLILFVQTSCHAHVETLSFMKNSLLSIGKENIVYALGVGACCLGLYYGWQTFGQSFKDKLFQSYPLRQSNDLDQEKDVKQELEEVKEDLTSKEQLKQQQENNLIINEKLKKLEEAMQKKEEENINLYNQVEGEITKRTKIANDLALLQKTIGLKEWEKRGGGDLTEKDSKYLAAVVRNQSARYHELLEKLKSLEYKKERSDQEILKLKKDLANAHKNNTEKLQNSFEEGKINYR